MRALVVTALLAGCAPHTEPERVVTFDASSGPFPFAAVEGDRLYVFHTDLNVLDLATGEVWNLGRAGGSAADYVAAVVTDGWAYWSGGTNATSSWIGRRADGRDREAYASAAAPRHLTGHRGCAYFTLPPTLYRWCPDEPEPVVITADGPTGDVAVDDDAAYFFASDGLTRLELGSGARSVIAGGAFGAEVAVDGDRIVWWRAGELFAVPRLGGETVALGTLPDTADPQTVLDLRVDEHGYYRGPARLRRDAADGEIWVARGYRHASGGGHLVWFESESQTHHVYRVPTDGDPVAPLGGDDDNLRPPFL